MIVFKRLLKFFKNIWAKLEVLKNLKDFKNLKKTLKKFRENCKEMRKICEKLWKMFWQTWKCFKNFGNIWRNLAIFWRLLKIPENWKKDIPGCIVIAQEEISWQSSVGFFWVGAVLTAAWENPLPPTRSSLACLQVPHYKNGEGFGLG